MPLGFRHRENFERDSLAIAGCGSSSRSGGININKTANEVHIARRSGYAIFECYGWDRADRANEIATFDSGLCSLREAWSTESRLQTFS